MIAIFYMVLLLLEIFSIPIAMTISVKADNNYIELVSLGYLLVLLFIMRYQLENLPIII